MARITIISNLERLRVLESSTSMLEEMFFVHHYFEVMFRRSFLINRILLNSEVWYGVTKYEIEELESVDHSLNIRILEAPACNTTPMLF